MTTTDQDTAPDISVVMGTYNGAAFLREQLTSILDQDLRPLEVIVADDGSSDETVQIVQQLADVAPIPIKLVQNSVNLGFGENFLAACDHASGQFIAFSDQDDIWYPSKLQASRTALTSTASLLCVHAVDDIDAHGQFLRRNDQRIGGTQVIERLEGDPWDVFYGFTMLFERSLLDHFGRQDAARTSSPSVNPCPTTVGSTSWLLPWDG